LARSLREGILLSDLSFYNCYVTANRVLRMTREHRTTTKKSLGINDLSTPIGCKIAMLDVNERRVFSPKLPEWASWGF
jgi:hypothetical protein